MTINEKQKVEDVVVRIRVILAETEFGTMGQYAQLEDIAVITPAVGPVVEIVRCVDGTGDERNLGKTGHITQILLHAEPGWDALYVVVFGDGEQSTYYHGELYPFFGPPSG